MRLPMHPGHTCEFGGGSIASIHLRRDTVYTVVTECEVKDGAGGFGSEALTAVVGIENPANLCDSMLSIGEPQQHISDRKVLSLDHEGKRSVSTIQVVARDSFRDSFLGVFEA